MSLAFASVVDTSVVIAIGLIAAALLRGHSAALRHWILAMAVVGAAATPALERLIPKWQIPVLPAAAATGDSGLLLTSNAPADATLTPAPATSALGSGDRMGVLVLSAWLGGSLISLMALASALWRLRRLGRRSTVVVDREVAQLMSEVAATPRQRRATLLMQSTHPGLVVTWGVRRPKILIPAGARRWSEQRVRAVLLHELAHVERADWGIHVLAALARSAYWFNPLIWIACRRLQHESERACDDAVIRTGVNGADYAEDLLAVARDAIGTPRVPAPANAIAHPSTLEERIQAMLTTPLNREPLNRRAYAVSTVVLLLVVVPVAAVTLSRTPAVPGPGGEASVRAAARPPTAIVHPSGNGVAAGQVELGGITGVLYDQHSGLLPGATVALTQDSTGASQSARSDASGAFGFRDLPPGDYTLVTRLPGFVPVRNMIRVAPGTTVQRNIMLPLGTVEEMITVSGSGASSTPASAPSRPQRLIPEPRIATPCVGLVGGCVKVPTKVFDVKPIYPSDLAVAGVQGLVVLGGRIGIDGYMSDLRLADRSAPGTPDAPHPDLVAAAIEAVRQWEFNPTYLNGAPVEANVSVSVMFTIR